MRKMLVEQSEESRPVWLYDLSLPIAERSEQKLHFRSLDKAGKFLDIDPRHVWTRLCDKHNVTSKKDGKKYAIRAASANPEKSQPMPTLKITIPRDKTVDQLFQESIKILERIRHWSSLKTREAELKKEMWIQRRDELLASLDIHSVSTEE